MELKKLTNSSHYINNGFGVLVLFSYNMPVAIRIHGREYWTIKKYSSTTTKHINAWCSDDATPVEQAILDRMCKEGDQFYLNKDL